MCVCFFHVVIDKIKTGCDIDPSSIFCCCCFHCLTYNCLYGAALSTIEEKTKFNNEIIVPTLLVVNAFVSTSYLKTNIINTQINKKKKVPNNNSVCIRGCPFFSLSLFYGHFALAANHFSIGLQYHFHLGREKKEKRKKKHSVE